MKNLLESNGILGFIKNEKVQGIGIAEIGNCWPELWLKDASQKIEAEELIKNDLAESSQEQPTWECQNCKEINEAQFNLCWQCSSSKS